MISAEVVSLRRRVITAQIARHGGRHITPEENRQPIARLRIASIRLGGIVGIGATEAAAQSDWLRQNAAKGAAGVVRS